MPIAGPTQPAGWRVLHVIKQGVVTSTMEGQAIFGMLSVLAGPQRELIVTNINDGLASARARGWSGSPGPISLPTRPSSPSSSYLFGVPWSPAYGHLDRKTVPRQPKSQIPLVESLTATLRLRSHLIW